MTVVSHRLMKWLLLLHKLMMIKYLIFTQAGKMVATVIKPGEEVVDVPAAGEVAVTIA